MEIQEEERRSKQEAALEGQLRGVLIEGHSETGETNLVRICFHPQPGSRERKGFVRRMGLTNQGSEGRAGRAGQEVVVQERESEAPDPAVGVELHLVVGGSHSAAGAIPLHRGLGRSGFAAVIKVHPLGEVAFMNATHGDGATEPGNGAVGVTGKNPRGDVPVSPASRDKRARVGGPPGRQVDQKLVNPVGRIGRKKDATAPGRRKIKPMGRGRGRRTRRKHRIGTSGT